MSGSILHSILRWVPADDPLSDIVIDFCRRKTKNIAKNPQIICTEKRGSPPLFRFVPSNRKRGPIGDCLSENGVIQFQQETVIGKVNIRGNVSRTLDSPCRNSEFLKAGN